MQVRRIVIAQMALLLALLGLASTAEARLVFTQTNEAPDNKVVVFDSDSAGNLTELDRVSTGGSGRTTNPPAGFPVLDSQGSVAYHDGFLFVVNGGSNTLSSFGVDTATGELDLLDVESTGGEGPLSVVAFRKYVYVLNGISENAVGFKRRSDGALISLGVNIPTTPDGLPAQIGVEEQDHDHLIVTERATDTIVTVPIGGDARPDGPALTQPSGSQTPFGFDVRGGKIVVSNAGSETPGVEDSTLSSYDVVTGAGVAPISQVPTFQTASCWVSISDVHRADGQIGYTTSPLSGTVTGFVIGDGGVLKLLRPNGDTAFASGLPLDIDVDGASKLVHVIVVEATFGPMGPEFQGAKIQTWKLRPDGALIPRGTTPLLPPGLSGLAAL